MFAESTIIPGTVPYLERLCIHVEILAILVVTFAKALEEVTNGHFGHFILVKKLALVSLLAQMAQPVFADHSSLSAHVTKRAMVATRTYAIQIELTQSSLVLCEINTMYQQYQ